MAAVCTCIYKGTTNILLCVRSQQHIQPAILQNDLRVAHMVGHIGREVVVRHQQRFAGTVDAVAAFHPQDVLLTPCVDIIVSACMSDVAGVIQVQLAVLYQG